jgi:hypothetical protein
MAGPDLAKATTGTIQRKLIAIPARVASSPRWIVLNLRLARSGAWTQLFALACGPGPRPRD